MTTSTRLSAYGAALLVAFAVAWGVGSAVGPVVQDTGPHPGTVAEHQSGEGHP